MDFFLSFLVFWGVWLLVPMFIDGLSTLLSLGSVLVVLWRRRRGQRPPLGQFPLVSIIIPVYNSEKTLEPCLRSIAAQDYPLDSLNILVINNGSSDRSFEVFSRMQRELPLRLHWHSIINKGKAWALNAGIHLTYGAYFCNVDSDVVLAPDAIRRIVEVMEAEPDLGAVTGAVEVLPPPADAPLLQAFLDECEFFEYLTAFHVGREQQTLLRNLYTLSGAFSFFRQDVILRTPLYSQRTVAEDTDMTFELYERFSEYRVGCVSEAIAYVHPIESLGALYAQRVRWQRGQIEVSARHAALMRRSIWRFSGFNPARALIIDHTLAFPRLVWTFLLPVLALFGYSLGLIFTALLTLYIFYMLIDFAWIGVAWLGVNPIARRRLRKTFWLLPFLPLYRMIIFWFRFSGFLYAVAELGTWRVQDPWTQIRLGWADLRSRWQTWLARQRERMDRPRGR